MANMTTSKLVFLASVLLSAVLPACSRDDVGQGIQVAVVQATEVRDPFTGETETQRQPAPQAAVYLLTFGLGTTATAIPQALHRAVADGDGIADFSGVEGRYRAWVDLEGDGVIDAVSQEVRSGERATVVVNRSANGDESTLRLSIERETYHPGDTINVTVWGTFATPQSVAVEIWNDAENRTKLKSANLGEFSGDFSATTAIVAQAGWPLTPNSRLGDYLAVPIAGGAYRDGARFSLRRPVQSYSMTNLSLQLNGGSPVTNIRNVNADLTGTNVSTVSLAENLTDLMNGIPPRLPFGSQVAYQLSAGDGIKTVYALYYDVDGNYAGPVSDTIYLDTQPVVPITGMKVEINYGAAITNSRNVSLALAATGATYMAFAENPALLPDNALRLPYAAQAGFQLSAGDGLKTVWVMYYDAYGRYYGPVSDSIVVDSSVPIAPVTGMSLTINGGAVTTNDRNVALTISANNAVSMAFSENPALFPNGVFRYPYDTDFGYRLSAGDGKKTIWALFFDAGGSYHGPVSASVNLVTQPTSPMTNLSLLINGGAPATYTTGVTLTLHADNAVMMAVAEDPAQLPNGAVRYPYQTSMGFFLSGTPGVKTVWAMFFDQWGNYAGPVSASIAYDSAEPPAPVDYRLFVTPNAPGMHDYLSGSIGAVQANNLVKVYSDPFLTNLLTQGYAGADGSFSLLDIGDGSAGNVFKPQDWVFVTATNSFGFESKATPVVNDSTPPELTGSEVLGTWSPDALGVNVGNAGDAFMATYIKPYSGPSTDVVLATVDLSAFTGPAAEDMSSPFPGVFVKQFYLPAGLSLDAKNLKLRMRVRDAAYNWTPWVTSTTLYTIDTIPPDPVTLNFATGGNKLLNAQWVDPNLDSATYYAHLTADTGATTIVNVTALDYCAANETRTCVYRTDNIDIGNPGTYTGSYPLSPVDNCNYWSVTMNVVDDGGNPSEFSNSVSGYTTLPPPDYEVWSGISRGTAMLAFRSKTVPNATAYEMDFSTATGAPYEYHTALYDIPFTTTTVDDDGVIERFTELPNDTLFYTSMRAIDDSSGIRCYSGYTTEVTARTEVYVAAVTDGTVRATVGGALASILDVDSDAYTDILAGAPFPQNVTLISGNTGQGIQSFGIYQAPDSYDIPGTPLAAANLDGPVDAAHEIVVGSPLETVGGMLLAGRVRVYDHDRSTVLAVLDGDTAGQQFGYSVAAGRVRASGYTDFAVGGFGCAHRNCGYKENGAAATEGPGKVVIYSGQTLTPLKTFYGGEMGDFFGVAIAGGRDITGDGIADYMIGAPGSGYVLPASPLTLVDGATLTAYAFPVPGIGATVGTLRPGAALAFIEDVTGDGVSDIAVGVPLAKEIPGMSGMVVLVAGGTFEVVWTQTGSIPDAGPNFGSVLAAGGDVNGDGVADLVVGAPVGQQNFFYGAGSAYVLDGATGKFLYEFHGWGEGAGSDGSVGYSVLLPGNLNSGPNAEWVVGAPGSAYGGYQSGRVYILSTDD